MSHQKWMFRLWHYQRQCLNSMAPFLLGYCINSCYGVCRLLSFTCVDVPLYKSTQCCAWWILSLAPEAHSTGKHPLRPSIHGWSAHFATNYYNSGHSDSTLRSLCHNLPAQGSCWPIWKTCRGRRYSSTNFLTSHAAFSCANAWDLNSSSESRTP